MKNASWVVQRYAMWLVVKYIKTEIVCILSFSSALAVSYPDVVFFFSSLLSIVFR